MAKLQEYLDLALACEKALDGAGRLTVGGVTFSALQVGVTYDRPPAEWDINAIGEDLSAYLARAVKAGVTVAVVNGRLKARIDA